MRRALGLSICVLAVGCIRADVQRLDTVVRPARPDDSITVLEEGPDQPYAVIATIESRGETIFDSFADLRRRMVTEAARLGGDALILEPESTESTFLIVHSTFPALIRSDVRELSGKVIVLGPPPAS